MRAAARIVMAGVALEALAVLDQLQWHAVHGAREPFGDITAAHAPIYAGAALGALGAALACAQARSRLSRSALALFVVAALVRAGAFALDARLHAAGADPTRAHDLYRDGAALAALSGGALALARIPARWRSLASHRWFSGYEYAASRRLERDGPAAPHATLSPDPRCRESARSDPRDG